MIINRDIDHIAFDIYLWAGEVFPDRTDGAMALKLYQEIGEMIESDGDPLEVADVLIMIFDYAKRKGIQLEPAIREKMKINRQRTWKINETTGTMSHVKN